MSSKYCIHPLYDQKANQLLYYIVTSVQQELNNVMLLAIMQNIVANKV